MSEHDRVELRPAFSWDCPKCGTENFARGIVPEMAPEELSELRDEHGVQPWEAGDFVMAPESVECKHCLLTWETIRFREDDSND